MEKTSIYSMISQKSYYSFDTFLQLLRINKKLNP